MATITHTPKMKILITGATSGLGRNACDIAQAQGHEVVAIGRNQSVLELLKKQGIDSHAFDLAQATLPEALLNNVDAIWHCAALSSPWGRYNDFYHANVVATERLVNLAGIGNVPKFIHISTPSLYFDYQSHPDIPETYLAKNFVNHYAKTKYLAELKVQNAVRHYPNTQYVMLRPRAIFGRYDNVLLPRLLKVIEQKGFLPLPNDGRAVMDFTYSDNVVEAMQLATQPPTTHALLTSGDVFNITNHEPMPIKDVLTHLFKEELGLDFKIKSLPYPLLYGLAQSMEVYAKVSQKEPLLTRYGVGALNFDMILNNDKAKQVLGYQPIYTMTAAIRHTAQLYQR